MSRSDDQYQSLLATVSAKRRVLGILARKYGAKGGGFKRCLQALAEKNLDEQCEEFDQPAVPLAYNIEEQEINEELGIFYKYNIHVYEIRISPGKLISYSRMADEHGLAELTLHLVDQEGIDLALYSNDLLGHFAFCQLDYNASHPMRPKWDWLHTEARTAARILSDSLSPLAAEPTDNDLEFSSYDLGRSVLSYSDLVARRLLTNKSTLHFWVHHRRFPTGFKVGKYRFWYANEVEEWLQNNPTGKRLRGNQSVQTPPESTNPKITRKRISREALTLYQALVELDVITPGELS